MSRIRWGWVLVAGVPALFIGYFFVYPLVRILVLGLSELEIRSTGVEARLLQVGWFTLWQAALSTVLTLVAAGPITWAVSRFEFRGRRLATALVTVPFVMPTVVVGTAFVALGWRDSIYAILAAHVFFNLAVVVRTVSALWSRLDPNLNDAARVLGASEWRAFRAVTLPLLRPAIAAAASIVFLFTFTSFGVVLVLGGYEFATLEVEIYRQAVQLFDIPLAAVLAIVQLVGVTGTLYAYTRFQERHSVSWALRPDADLPRPRGAIRWLVAVSVVLTLAALAIPFVVMIARSLGADSYTALLGADRVAGVPLSAMANSLIFAMVAMVLATAIGMMAAAVISSRKGRLSSWFDLTLMLPLGTSAVTIDGSRENRRFAAFASVGGAGRGCAVARAATPTDRAHRRAGRFGRMGGGRCDVVRPLGLRRVGRGSQHRGGVGPGRTCARHARRGRRGVRGRSRVVQQGAGTHSGRDCPKPRGSCWSWRNTYRRAGSGTHWRLGRCGRRHRRKRSPGSGRRWRCGGTATPDGMAVMTVRLLPADMAGVQAAVDGRVRAWRPDASADASRRWPSLANQRADAFVELCRDGVGGVTTEVVLHVRGDGCSMDDGSPVSESAVARVARVLLPAGVDPRRGRPPHQCFGPPSSPDNAANGVSFTNATAVCVDCGATDLLEYDHDPPFEQSQRTIVDELRLRCAQCHHRRHRIDP